MDALMWEVMTGSDRWRRVQELCEQLEGVAPADQAGMLAGLEGDASIRDEALAVLAAMEAEAAVSAVERKSVLREHPVEVAGLRVTGYLGSGGSGLVYRAVRVVNGVEQIVAVKLFHEQQARFVREQRMLASLNHPGIVKFLDAGVTAEHQAYLVMELAEGERVTEYCSRKNLNVAERLRLMVRVCEVVQAAHRCLIVHLDLKPSNVLVTAEGEVKLLDFGTAQLMDASGRFETTQQMTPLYASPEQLRGDAPSVACDVYALGLILFELLSGGWPFLGRNSVVALTERASGRVEAGRLGVLSRELKGDLEAICGKALAHEPGARYGSVIELGADIERYLAGEPVVAHPPGFLYIAGKYVRRHATAILVACLFVLGLGAAAIYSYGQARKAEREALRAERVKQFITALLLIPGSDVTARADMKISELLAYGEARIEPMLGNDPATAAEVEAALANGFSANDDFQKAHELTKRALARASAGGDLPMQAVLEANLSMTSYLRNQSEEAWDWAQKAVALWKKNPGKFSPQQAVETLSNAARTMSYVRMADPQHRIYLEEAVRLSAAHRDQIFPVTRALGLSALANSYHALDFRYAEAYPLIQEAIAINRADPLRQRALADSLLTLGIVARYLGRAEESEKAMGEGVRGYTRIYGAGSLEAATLRGHWGVSLAEVGRKEEGFSEAQKALEIKRRWYPKAGSYLLWTNLGAAAYTACLTQRYKECEVLVREGLVSLGPTVSEEDYRVHDARAFLGIALAGQGKKEEAKQWLEDSIRFNARRGRAVPFKALLVP